MKIKGKRKFISIVCATCLALISVIFVSCGKQEEESSQPEQSGVALSLNEANLDLYENVQISVLGEYVGEIVWQSADENVAIVEDGMIYAKGEGATTITAMFGTDKRYCNVKVEDSGGRPNLACQEGSDIGVLIGDKYTVTPITTYKGNTIQAELVYQVEDTTIAEVSADGEVTGKAFGQTTLIISGSYRGYTFIPLEIEVNVSNDVEIELSETEVTLYASSPNGEITEKTVTATVFNKGAVVNNAIIEWVTADETIALCDGNGKVSAVSAGETELIAKYSINGKVYDAVILVNVIRPSVAFGNIDVDLSKAVGDYAYLNLNYDATIVTEVIATENNESVPFIAEGNSLKIEKDLLVDRLGVNQVEIITTKAKYVGQVTVATCVISTAEDLEAMIGIARIESSYTQGSKYTYYKKADGYFVLATNIDYQNKAFGLTDSTAENEGFVGIFDGRGYTISNIKVADGSRGLFGGVGKTGVIKNVAFINVQNTENNDPGDGYNRRNLLTYTFYGTIENVYIEAARGAITGAFSAVIGQYKAGTIKNLVAVITETASKSSQACVGTVIGAMQNKATDSSPIANIVGVSSLYSAIQDNGWDGDSDIHVTTTKNVQSFTSVEDANGTYLAMDWDATIWNISNGIPIFKTMVWMNDLTSQANCLDYDLSLSETVQQEVNLTGITGAVTGIYANGKTLEGWNYSDGKLLVSRTFAMALLDGKKYGDFVITIETENNGNRAFYKVNATVVTKVIHNAEDLEAMIGIARIESSYTQGSKYTYYKKADGYFVLAANIDYQNKAFGLTDSTAENEGFIGIFDGRGYTISNIKVADGSRGLFGGVGKTGVIKNVAFINVQNTENNDPGDGYNRRNLLTYTFYGTLENVYIEATRGAITGAFSGVIGQYKAGTIKNLVAVITETASKSSQVCVGTVIGAMQDKATDSSPIANVVGVSSLYPAIQDNGWDGDSDIHVTTTKNVQSFTSVEDANGTYLAADWDAQLWDINGEIPVFKTAKAVL